MSADTIMGRIWEATDGTVVADLPDWGYVLIEDPHFGAILAEAPIPSGQLDPTREK